MKPLHPHTVTATARTEGAIGIFETRQFLCMLPYLTLKSHAQAEALRIIRQQGFEPGVVLSIQLGRPT